MRLCMMCNSSWRVFQRLGATHFTGAAFYAGGSRPAVRVSQSTWRFSLPAGTTA
jgi:hypothetical protein